MVQCNIRLKTRRVRKSRKNKLSRKAGQNVKQGEAGRPAERPGQEVVLCRYLGQTYYRHFHKEEREMIRTWRDIFRHVRKYTWPDWYFYQENLINTWHMETLKPALDLNLWISTLAITGNCYHGDKRGIKKLVSMWAVEEDDSTILIFTDPTAPRMPLNLWLACLSADPLHWLILTTPTHSKKLLKPLIMHILTTSVCRDTQQRQRGALWVDAAQIWAQFRVTETFAVQTSCWHSQQPGCAWEEESHCQVSDCVVKILQ